jgi:hypothetical protein
MSLVDLGQELPFLPMSPSITGSSVIHPETRLEIVTTSPSTRASSSRRGGSAVHPVHAPGGEQQRRRHDRTILPRPETAARSAATTRRGSDSVDAMNCYITENRGWQRPVHTVSSLGQTRPEARGFVSPVARTWPFSNKSAPGTQGPRAPYCFKADDLLASLSDGSYVRACRSLLPMVSHGITSFRWLGA